MEVIITGLKDAITTFGSNAMDAIGGIIPVALPIFGAVAVVGIGLKVFKKVTGQ